MRMSSRRSPGRLGLGHEGYGARAHCVPMAASPQRPLAMRTEAARVVHESGDGESVKAAQERELPDAMKAALPGLKP